jgi:hypothetical protein
MTTYVFSYRMPEDATGQPEVGEIPNRLQRA